ncbi:MAG TPA: hypothetical protein PKD16_14300 [Saprospiraceae bacterium]|nr:hypothetical protein [Saprospiraceae bacterium]HMT71334.1 hypothetical protein [Saprospiraceae bacterium]
MKLNESKVNLSPRRVKYWECCITKSTELILNDSMEASIRLSGIFGYQENSKQDFILNQSFELYKNINQKHAGYEIENFIFETMGCSFIKDENDNEVSLVEIHLTVPRNEELKPKIAIANTIVYEANIIKSIKMEPNINKERYKTLGKLLKESRKNQADILILPECSVPYSMLPLLAKYSEKNGIAIIAGLEHWNVKGYCYNFIVTILPFNINGINDALVLYRLKNHYSPGEKNLIEKYGYKVPLCKPFRYDLFKWNGIYFTSFYCFELADSTHRSLFKSKVDLVIASEWNRDIPYFSNIVEALSRDIHCYVAQVNTSQYGDSRVTKPTESILKDIIRLKGGKNDTVIVDEIDITSLRNFQTIVTSGSNKDFKPLPPNWNFENVKRRIKGQWLLPKSISTPKDDIKTIFQ